MQLDRTNVVIRARTLSEIGDLALILIRSYPGAAILGFAAGALPWALLNWLLVGWIPLPHFTAGIHDEQMNAALSRYLFLMTSLVIVQAPIAGVMTTMLIGRIVFEQQVSWKRAWADLRNGFWRWFWVLGVLRGPLPLMLVLASNWGQELAIGREVFIPVLFLFVAGIQRGWRPFMPEILLLERCPLRSRSPEVITARRRSAALHDPLAGELIGRFITVALMLGVLFLAVLYSLGWARGVLFGWWEWSLVVYGLFVPAALWAVAGLSVLIRFLSYLDARIRLEGWEVDLAVRAEAQRQFGDEAPVASHAPPGSAKKRATVVAPLLLAVVCGHAPAARASSPARLTGVVAVAQATAEPAAAAPEIALPPATPWYDEEQRELRPVPVTTRLPTAEHRASRWEPAPPKPQAPAASSSGNSGDYRILGWILLAGFAIALIALLFYLVGKIEPAVSVTRQRGSEAARDEPDEQTLERIRELPAEVRRTDVNLRAEAERLMNLGRFDAALVLLFGHQLLLLDRGGILRLARGKTNGRYLRETRGKSPAAHALFTRSVAAFEASYFGGHAPQADQFARLWAENAELEALVAAQWGAAA